MMISEIMSKVAGYIFDPFTQDKPKIVWVKLVRELSIYDTYLIKTENGITYQRNVDDPSKKWTEYDNQDKPGFQSSYLESIISEARSRGLYAQTSAATILYNGRSSPFDLPSHSDFDDRHTIEDIKDKYPEFAEYLKQKKNKPLWFNNNPGGQEPDKNPTPF